jgi:murein L,D-transpeptidase YcbB/YkuD
MELDASSSLVNNGRLTVLLPRRVEIMERRSAFYIVSALIFATFALPGTIVPAQASWLENSPNETAQALRDALSSNPKSPVQLTAFYKARNYEPAWSGSDIATAHADTVRELLAHADDQGLRPSDYAAPKALADSETDPAKIAQYDMAMTRAFLLYMWDVRVGRFKPSSVYSDVQLPAKTPDIAHQANAILSHRSIDDALAALPPPSKDYRALVDALARYRTVAKNGGWPQVTASSTKSLAKRLAAEDPAIAADADGDAVTDALHRYETRNGFEPSDTPTPAIVAALNIPVQTRIRQIEANLERQRWIPEKFENRYILVNVPDQSVAFIRKGKVMLQSKVVVGTPRTTTPILRTEVKAVVVNPPWDIPDFIAAKALLPHLRKDSNYLQTRNIILADGPADDPYGQKINWRKVTAKTIPYQIQQPPGDNNALGNVMLDMPNDFDVYLHDTPQKQLFTLDNREKSNGCIRVEQIMALASLVMTDDKEDGLDEINEDIATGKTQRIALGTPMPVYLFYWTALPQDDGTLGFRPDRYNRDQKLIAMMNATPARDSKPANPSKKPAKPVRISSNAETN